MIPQISNKELAKELAEQLAITKAEEQIVEETEVVEDNGAPKRKVKKVKKVSEITEIIERMFLTACLILSLPEVTSM